MVTSLYVSCARPASLAAALEAPPSVVILDLEDSVPDEAKARAREVLPYLIGQAAGAARVVVRVNAPTTEEGRADLAALPSDPASVTVLIAKPVNEQAIREVVRSRPTGSALWCMAESPESIDEIASWKGLAPSLEAVVIGYKDLALSLNQPFDTSSQGLRSAATAILAAGRRCGLTVIDGVTIGDSGAVAQAAVRAAGEGFDGVSLFRPSDVAAATQAFRVSR